MKENKTNNTISEILESRPQYQEIKQMVKNNLPSNETENILNMSKSTFIRWIGLKIFKNKPLKNRKNQLKNTVNRKQTRNKLDIDYLTIKQRILCLIIKTVISHKRGWIRSLNGFLKSKLGKTKWELAFKKEASENKHRTKTLQENIEIIKNMMESLK